MVWEFSFPCIYLNTLFGIAHGSLEAVLANLLILDAFLCLFGRQTQWQSELSYLNSSEIWAFSGSSRSHGLMGAILVWGVFCCQPSLVFLFLCGLRSLYPSGTLWAYLSLGAAVLNSGTLTEAVKCCKCWMAWSYFASKQRGPSCTRPKTRTQQFFCGPSLPGFMDQGLQIILIKEINKAQVSGKRQYVEIVLGICH